MTKVQIQYSLSHEIDETVMDRIAAAHGTYGLTHIRLLPSLKDIAVEYDASRLTGEQVLAALFRAGIPVKPPQEG
ncbi:MAG: hypothetical protein JNN08_28720 [Bryobacterales bacterium]|nr:hypothetical protein [Bryobacterales bacterium]